MTEEKVAFDKTQFLKLFNACHLNIIQLELRIQRDEKQLKKLRERVEALEARK